MGTVALTLSFGCARFGYNPVHDASVPAPDAGHPDAGGTPDIDAGKDAEVSDGAAVPIDSGSVDAAHHDDAGTPMDSGPEPEDDAGGTDAATPDLCPGRDDAVFCDSFEDPDFSSWSYPVISNGKAEPSTDRRISGEHSLHATTGPAMAGTAARWGVRAFDHQKSGDIWLRSYYYMPSSTVANPMFSTCVVAEIEQPYFGFSLAVFPSRVAIAHFEDFYQGTLPFPRDRWTCVELHVHIDTRAGISEAYFDGELAARTPEMDTVPDRGYTSVDVGIHYTAPEQGPVEVYVDDVVAGNTRVGCQ